MGNVQKAACFGACPSCIEAPNEKVCEVDNSLRARATNVFGDRDRKSTAFTDEELLWQYNWTQVGFAEGEDEVRLMGSATRVIDGQQQLPGVQQAPTGKAPAGKVPTDKAPSGEEASVPKTLAASEEEGVAFDDAASSWSLAEEQVGTLPHSSGVEVLKSPVKEAIHTTAPAWAQLEGRQLSDLGGCEDEDGFCGFLEVGFEEFTTLDDADDKLSLSKGQEEAHIDDMVRGTLQPSPPEKIPLEGGVLQPSSPKKGPLEVRTTDSFSSVSVAPWPYAQRLAGRKFTV